MRRAFSALLLTLLAAAMVGRVQADPDLARLARDSILVLAEGASGGSAFAEALAHDYPMTLSKQWPVRALDAHCYEFIVNATSNSEPLLQLLRRDPRVAQVQKNQLHHVSGMPVKDPYFDLQARTRQGGVDSILRRGSGRGVRIAVVDTGVDMQHPDLIGRISEAVNFVGGPSGAVPAEFHGTAVVGLISSTPGNGIGIHGIAPDAELLALRACWEAVYSYGLCSTNTLARALDYAIEVRARIINLSLAGPEDPLLEKLVNRAIELGAVVFGAVGEEESQRFPTSIAGVIAVDQGVLSNAVVAGPRLVVPGRQLLTTVPDGRYDFVSGSSFATAHASGVAAVMLERQPHLRAEELADWLQRLHGN